MTVAHEIAQVGSPALRRSLESMNPPGLGGALAALAGLLMQPLAGVRPVTDGLAATVSGDRVSLHVRGASVSVRLNGETRAVATGLADLEQAFFDTLFSTGRGQDIALAA